MKIIELLKLNRELLKTCCKVGVHLDDVKYIDLYADYLDVLTVLNGHSYIYFTSNKSSIIELCEWIGHNQVVGNPFAQATRVEYNANVNYSARYTDIMLYNTP